MNPPAPILPHPAAPAYNFNPPIPTYTGFLGSEATRFAIHDQRTTDVHYTNYFPPNAPGKCRQRTSAIAQGLSFASPETRIGFQNGVVDGVFPWPVNEVWIPDNGMMPWLRFYNRGPSQPGPFPAWPINGIYEPPVMAWTGGQWRAGYCVRWFHETTEWHLTLGPGGYPLLTPLFYYEHEKRGKDEHHIDLPILPHGKRCRFDKLYFETQIQLYRRAGR